jgi:hypothetical protein
MSQVCQVYESAGKRDLYFMTQVMTQGGFPTEQESIARTFGVSWVLDPGMQRSIRWLAGSMEIIIRFLIGGAVVSAFSLAGGLFKPVSFAGLFGAAPSIALATLGLVIAKDGSAYASTECRSMIAGAVAFFAYCLFTIQCLMRFRLPTGISVLLSTLVWFLTAFGLWRVLL